METLSFSENAGLATIAFNRPNVLNAINRQMALELAELASSLKCDRSTKVVILKGAGSTFSAGGDVSQFRTHLSTIAGLINDVIDGFHTFVHTIATIPQPVIASINGAAAGGGLSLVLCCDFAIAAKSAKFTFAYHKLGASPDGGATFHLPRMVGPKRALELLLLREWFSAEEACSLGLINQVVDAAELDCETEKLATALLRNSPETNASIKALLNRSATATLADQLLDEQRAFVSCSTKDDFAEGVQAFAEKRVPIFGRKSADQTLSGNKCT